MTKPVPVICLGGPTGCGKSELGLELADRLDGEIVNADSRQLYRDFPIITAQPTREDLARHPHHLYGFLDTGQKISAGVWSDLAAKKAAEIRERGKVPLIIGGTGFYIRSLLEGLAKIPPIPPEISGHWQMRMQEEGNEKLYRLLEKTDPAYAVKINSSDRQRIQRALEVHAFTGRTFSWWHGQTPEAPLCAGPLFLVDISLEELTPFLYIRIGKMIAAGALDEAEKAYSLNRNGNAPGWSGIGCAELFQWLEGRLDLPDCERLWRKQTRAYAKRQLIWFRGRKNGVWLKRTELVAEAQMWVRKNF